MKSSKVPKWKQKLNNQNANQSKNGSFIPSQLNEGQARKQLEKEIEQRQFGLNIHTKDHSPFDILLKQDTFQEYLGLKPDAPVMIEVLYVCSKGGQVRPEFESSSSELYFNKSIVLYVSFDQLKSQRNELSISKEICEVHHLNEMCQVKIKKIHRLPLIGPQGAPKSTFSGISTLSQMGSEPNINTSIFKLTAFHVELSFKDQFVSRRDMWYITQKLDKMTVYKSKQLEIDGIRVRIRSIFDSNSVEILNGLIQLQKTKFSFSSKSSQVQLLIEASSDMYSFDHNGQLQIEKTLTFIRSYFDRCLKQFGCTSELSVVVFARLYYPQVQSELQLKEELKKHFNLNHSLHSYSANNIGAFLKSKHVKFFQDVYLKVGIFETQKQHAEKCVMATKRVLNYLPSLVNWNLNCPTFVSQMKAQYPFDQFMTNNSNPYGYNLLLDCQLGNSEKSQILEAINMSLFNLNNENMDQNLKKTGHQLIIISAGIGAYRVNADMIIPTKSRALLGGTPVMLVSLAPKPPFQTPLFIRCCTYKNPFLTRNKLYKNEVFAQQMFKHKQKHDKIPGHNNLSASKRKVTFNDFLSNDDQNMRYLKTIENDQLNNEVSRSHSLFYDQFNDNHCDSDHDSSSFNSMVDDQENHGNSQQKQKFYFASWIQMVYLFDHRLIDSNLFMHTVLNPHGSDLAQPIDALNSIERSLPIESFQFKKPFIPQPLFEFLNFAKKAEVQKQNSINKLAVLLKEHVARIEEAEYEQMDEKAKQRSKQLFIQFDDFMLDETPISEKARNELRDKLIRHDQMATINSTHQMSPQEPNHKPHLHISTTKLKAQQVELAYKFRKKYIERSPLIILDNAMKNSQSLGMIMAQKRDSIADIYEHGQQLETNNQVQGRDRIMSQVSDYELIDNSNKKQLKMHSQSQKELIPNSLGFNQQKTLETINLKKPAQNAPDNKAQGGITTSKQKLMNIIYEQQSMQTSQYENDSVVSKEINVIMATEQSHSSKIKKPKGLDVDLDIEEPKAMKSEIQQQLHLKHSFRNLKDDPEQEDSFTVETEHAKAQYQSFQNKNETLLDQKVVLKDTIANAQQAKEVKSPNTNEANPKIGEQAKLFEYLVFNEETQDRIRCIVEQIKASTPIRQRQNMNLNSRNTSPFKRTSQPASSNNSPHRFAKKITATKRRWTHSYVSMKHLQVQFLSNQQILSLLASPLDRVQKAAVIEQMYMNFWKQICECKLLPITTDYYPDSMELKKKESNYKYEKKAIEKPINAFTLFKTQGHFLNEFLCLRLSQNMQFLSKDGTCFFDSQQFRRNKLDLKLGIGDLHHELEFFEEERYNLGSYVHLHHDISDEMSANFKYLLFNYYTNQFQVKHSKESRLFNFNSIANIDETLDEFALINEVCMKVPQIYFVLIPSKFHEGTKQTFIDNFNKFRQSLINLVTNNGTSVVNQQKMHLREIKVVERPKAQLNRQNTQGNKKMTSNSFYKKGLQKLNTLSKPASVNMSTIFFEDFKTRCLTGAYLLECDPEYFPAQSVCFHIKFSWIFATSLQMQDTIKSFQRRAKECDFDAIPISGIVQNECLNPFEVQTVLRDGAKHDYVQALQEIDMELAMLTQNLQNPSSNDELEAELLQNISSRLKAEAHHKHPQQPDHVKLRSRINSEQINDNLSKPMNSNSTSINKTPLVPNEARGNLEMDGKEESNSLKDSNQLHGLSYQSQKSEHSLILDIQKLQRRQDMLNTKLQMHRYYQTQVMSLLQSKWMGFICQYFSTSTSVLAPNGDKSEGEVTTFIHLSGSAVINLNMQTNHLMWLDNDVYSSTMVSLVQSKQAEKENAHYWNLANNDYSLSKKLQTKAEGLVLALDILVDLVFSDSFIN